MRNNTFIIRGGVLVFLMWSSILSEIVLNPPAAGTSWDYGMVVKGRYPDAVDNVADGQVLTRTGLFINQSGVFNDRLNLSVTLGGILFWSLPERSELTAFHTRILFPGGALGEARASYVFGDIEEPFLEVKAGFFPIKYNSDAKNLGEYLYRSGTYPGVLYSGGWSYINSAAYMAQGFGFRLNTLEGKWVHDLTFTLERGLEPTNNISPAFVSTFKASSFEIAAGFQWAHLIPLKPEEMITPDASAFNAYYLDSGLPVAYDDSLGEAFKPHYRTGDTAIVDQSDSRWGMEMPGRPGKNYVTADENGIPGEALGYYTFQGIKTMARASLNLGNLLGMDDSQSQDAFKIYSELALLGVEDQPFFYEDKSERMPIMFGINIPTFGLLDILSFEVEYRKSRFPNDIRYLFENQFPIAIADVEDYSVYDPDHPQFTDYNNSRRSSALKFLGLEDDSRYDSGSPDFDPSIQDLRAQLNEKFEEDDWKWSLYARRQIMEGLTLSGQVASDHQRHFTITAKDGPRPNDFPTTLLPKEWYFILRLEMGI